MDYVMLSGLAKTHAGLVDMLNASEPCGGELIEDSQFANVADALFVIEVAKRAKDRDDWFPCGKWATIQAIQGRCEAQLSKLFDAGKAVTE